LKKCLLCSTLLLLWVVPAFSTLRAGVSQVDMTPDVGTPLCGYGDRLGMPCTGIHDLVYARCLVLESGDERIALVSCDLCIMERVIRETVLSKLPAASKINSKNLMIAATHTHAAQGAYTQFRLARIATGAYDPELVEKMSNQIVQAIQEAVDDLVEVRLGWGRTEDDRLSRNRAVDDGPTDPEICVLRIDRKDGTRLATVCNFSAHPTIMGGADNMLVSAEWPGVYSTVVAEDWGGIALFVNGSQGDQRPGNPTGTSGWDRVEGMGKALADTVLRLLPHIEMKESIEISSRTERAQFRTVIQSPMTSHGALCQVFTIGNTLWMALPGETCVDIGRRLKEGATSVGYDLAFVISCANEHLGYFVSYDYYVNLPRYETSMCFTGPRTDDMFVRTFAKISPRPFAAPPEPPDAPAGSVTMINGIRLIHVKGAPYEMGVAYGKAIQSVYDAMLDDLTRQIQIVAKQKRPIFSENPGVFIGSTLLSKDWVNPRPLLTAAAGMMGKMMNRHIPEEYRLEIEGMAQGLDIPYDEAVAINVCLTLIEQNDKSALSGLLPLCTNIVAFGNATSQNQMVVGRNLDWGFIETLGHYGCVVLFEPDEGYRFLSVGWPGQIGTLTAMNEAGLTITEESIASPKDTSVDGVPIMLLLRKIAQYAGTVDEALEIIRKHPGTCGYHIVISDSHGDTARVMEVSGRHQAVRVPVEGVLLGCAPWQTTEEFFEGSLPAPEIARTDGSSLHRYERARDLCQEYYGQIDVEIMKIFMSDSLAEKQGMQNICNDSTIQSIIFLPKEGKMWVAHSRMGKPAPHSGYTEFSF